jgi:hypothetical protein
MTDLSDVPADRRKVDQDVISLDPARGAAAADPN